MISANPKRRRGKRDKSQSNDSSAHSDPVHTNKASISAAPSSTKTPRMLLPDSLNQWHTVDYLKNLKLPTSSLSAASATSAPGDMVTQFRALADGQLSAERTRYDAYIRTLSSDDQWLRSTATGSAGTASDRVSSATLLLQSQPVLNLSLLPDLVKLGGSDARLQNMVCESLLDLFSSNLLPEDRPLISLFDRPLEQYTGGKNQLSPKLLMLWRHEEVRATRRHAHNFSARR